MTFEQLMTVLAVVGTGVGTTLVQIYREHRNRKWQIEDTERARRDLAEQVKLAERDLAARAAASQRVIIKKLDENSIKLDVNVEKANAIAAQVEENTAISRIAFDAANDFSTKVAKLSQAYDGVALRTIEMSAASAAENAEALPKIKQTGEDTNERVRVIEEAQEVVKSKLLDERVRVIEVSREQEGHG